MDNNNEENRNAFGIDSSAMDGFAEILLRWLSGDGDESEEKPTATDPGQAIVMAAAIRDRLSITELLTQLAEEAAELSQAALKYRRSLKTYTFPESTKLRYEYNPTPVQVWDALDNLIEETTDVYLCLMALEMDKIDAHRLEKKAVRWLDRLSGER